jgi:TolA-binding protein
MTNLPEDLKDLLAAERDIEAPASAERQRIFARLEPLLIVPVALAAGSSSVATAADATGSAAVGFLKGKVAVAVVSAALIGGAVGATGHAYLSSPTPRSTGATGATTVSTVAPPTVPNVVPEPASSAPDEPTATPSAAAAPSQSSGPRERSHATGSLRAERLLLEAASAALMRGDPESAIPALRKHAQRFPNGALAEEREALLERALAASRKPQ